MFETIINGFSGVKNGGDRNKNEYSSPFSFRNMVILPILGGFGAHSAPLGPNSGVTNNRECFETIINGLSGVENGGIGTKMSTLAILVSEIW